MLYRLLFLCVLLALTGCYDSFENSLPWDHSQRANSLVGSWELVDDDETGELKVSKNSLGEYIFEFYEGEQKSSVLVDVLSSKGVDVVQFRLATFEISGDDEDSKYKGYSFARLSDNYANGEEFTLSLTDLEVMEELSNTASSEGCKKTSADDLPVLFKSFSDEGRCKILNFSGEQLSELFIGKKVFLGEVLKFTRLKEIGYP